MASRRIRLVFAFVCLAVAGCSSPNPGAPAAPVAAAPSSPATVAKAPVAENQEKPAMPSLVVDTVDGKKFDLAGHRGRWVIVNFWATWCNPCLKEMPDLDAFDAARDDVDVVGLAYEEIEPAEMAAFLKEHVVHYPIALLDVYKPPADFETPRGLPMTYVIAPDGTVAKKFLGPVTTADLGVLIRDASKLQPRPSA